MVKLLSVADGVTILNAILGFIALLLVFSGQFQLAASLILLGLLADGLDGMIARRMGNSQLGQYLETIADLVSLSVAPLILVYQTYSEMISEFSLLLLFGVVLGCSFICSIIRLSSFSFLKDKDVFVGLPTSASAIFLVVVSYMKPPLWAVLPLILIFSFAMISSVHFLKPGLRLNLIAAFFIVATIVLDGRYENIAPFLLVISLACYIIAGLVFLYFKKNQMKKKPGTHN
jgi:archaetidylserine synthase